MHSAQRTHTGKQGDVPRYYVFIQRDDPTCIMEQTGKNIDDCVQNMLKLGVPNRAHAEREREEGMETKKPTQHIKLFLSFNLI